MFYINILPLAYHQAFLAATLDLPSFSQWPSWGPHTFLTAGLFWIRSVYHYLQQCYLYCLGYW